jgi:hypothetical protein
MGHPEKTRASDNRGDVQADTDPAADDAVRARIDPQDAAAGAPGWSMTGATLGVAAVN